MIAYARNKCKTPEYMKSAKPWFHSLYSSRLCFTLMRVETPMAARDKHFDAALMPLLPTASHMRLQCSTVHVISNRPGGR